MTTLRTMKVSTLGDAVAKCLEEEGTDVLRDSQKFARVLKDVCGSVQLPEAEVFVRNCDDELLGPLVEVTSSPNRTTDGLQVAAARTATILHDDRFVSQEMADRIAGQLMVGIVRHVGLVPQPVEATTSANDTFPSDGSASFHKNSQSASMGEAALNKKHKHKIIIALFAVIAVVGIVLAVFFLFVAPRLRTGVLLLDYDGNTMQQKRVEGWRGGNINLPETFVERDGYEFIGWAPVDGPADADVIEPGESVKIDDSRSYQGVWQIQVSFDGNGADSGSMDSIAVETNKECELPESKFSKKGFVFSGWSTAKNGEGSLRLAGESEIIYEPVTYYAVWKPQQVIGEVSIKDLKECKGTVEGWDESMGAVVLLITNDSNKTVSLKTSLSLLNDSGNKVADDFDFVCCVGSGESSLVARPLFEKKGAVKASYNIEVTDVGPIYESAASIIDQEVVSTDKDKLALKLTNKGDKDILVDRVCVIAKDKAGALYVANAYYTAGLKPGESGEASFNESSMIAYGQKVPDWREADCVFYVTGYSTTV